MMELFSSNNPFKRKRPHSEVSDGDGNKEAAPARPPTEEPVPPPSKKVKNDEVGSAGTLDEEPGKFSEEKLRRTIFVGNLSIETKKKALIKEFAIYGAVESARLRSVPVGTINLPRKAAVSTGQTNESRNSVNAYVVFKGEESAEAALAHNMKLVGDKHIRVDRSVAPRRRGESSAPAIYDNDRSIFLGNVPFDVEDEELHALFSVDDPELALEAVRVVRDQKTNIGKGFAFVLFKSQAGVKEALSRRPDLQLRGRPLRVHRVANKEDSKPGRRSGSSKSKTLSYQGTTSGNKQRRPTDFELSKASSQKKRARGTGKKRPAVAARKQAQLAAKAGTVGG